MTRFSSDEIKGAADRLARLRRLIVQDVEALCAAGGGTPELRELLEEYNRAIREFEGLVTL